MNRPGRWLTAAATAVVLLGAGLPAQGADVDDAPSKTEVRSAERAAEAGARSVAAVQAELVLAQERVQSAGIAAAQALEDWHAARFELTQARQQARDASERAAESRAGLAEHEAAYGDVLAAAYEMSPEVTALAAIVGEDGIDGVVEQANTMFAMTSAMDEVQARYEAALAVADLATDRAERATARATELQARATEARAAARAQQEAAAAEAAAVAAEREALITELADLQDVSVALASRRQEALEAAAVERMAAGAATAAAERSAAEQAAAAGDQTESTQGAADQPASADAGSAPDPAPAGQPDPPAQPAPAPEPAPQPAPAPAQPQPDPEPEPQPAPAPEPKPDPEPAPPPPASGASAAISFARAQIGDRYRWGGNGPDAWDCSGLTTKAWQQGGTYLPRTSRYQYAASTPIRHSQLRPGDLLFWSSNGGQSGIYHVALYTGNGMMVHAPNSNRRVVEESMYIWAPNLYARP